MTLNATCRRVRFACRLPVDRSRRTRSPRGNYPTLSRHRDWLNAPCGTAARAIDNTGRRVAAATATAVAAEPIASGDCRARTSRPRVSWKRGKVAGKQTRALVAEIVRWLAVPLDVTLSSSSSSTTLSAENASSDWRYRDLPPSPIHPRRLPRRCIYRHSPPSIHFVARVFRSFVRPQLCARAVIDDAPSSELADLTAK